MVCGATEVMIMSEYFFWANIDKKQFLSPSDFGCGCRLHESMHRENTPMSALYALLSMEWKGDCVLFLGDEGKMPFPSGYDVFRLINRQIQDYHQGDYHYFDFIMETYWNLSALFKDTEPELRPEFERCIDRKLRHHDDDRLIQEYQMDVEHPFEGLFWRNGMNFRYMINHTKKVYYSFTQTTIRFLDSSENPWADPLPILMAYGRTANIGPWVGDIIGVGDSVDETYSPLKEIYLDW